MFAVSGNPSVENRHIVRIEGHEIGAISRREPAQHAIEAEERRRMR
jgi:hypothetical protein